jgi:hypothetical protein
VAPKVKASVSEPPQRLAARRLGRQPAGRQLLDPHLDVEPQLRVDLGLHGLGPAPQEGERGVFRLTPPVGPA